MTSTTLTFPAMRPGPDTAIAPAADVVTREHNGRLIAVSLDTGRCWEMNRTGTAMWQALSAGRTVDQVTRDVALEYGVDHQVVQKDALILVEGLLEAGLAVLRS